MKKKILSVLLVAAMAISMLAGCGGRSDAAGGSDSNVVEQDATSKELVVWCWDPAFNIFSMEEAAKVYKAEHPDVTVTVEEVPWNDIQTRLTTAATSGDLSTLPDIFLMQDNAFQKNVMAYGSAFVDLTGAIDFTQFAAGKTAYSVVGGKNYGVPFDNGAVIGCYRTDLLAQAGLTIDDFTDITWAQYIENGKKVKEATGKPLVSMQAGECDLLIKYSSINWRIASALSGLHLFINASDLSTVQLYRVVIIAYEGKFVNRFRKNYQYGKTRSHFYVRPRHYLFLSFLRANLARSI